MSEVISLRFDRSRRGAIDFLAKREGVPKAKAIRLVFDLGMVSMAVNLYKQNKLSLERAANLSGLSVSEFMDELTKQGIKANISLEDFEESLVAVKALAKSKTLTNR